MGLSFYKPYGLPIFIVFKEAEECVSTLYSLRCGQSRSLLPSTRGEAWTFQIICNVISGIGLLQTLWVAHFFGEKRKELKEKKLMQQLNTRLNYHMTGFYTFPVMTQKGILHFMESHIA